MFYILCFFAFLIFIPVEDFKIMAVVDFSAGVVSAYFS
jgi:hypothetical protein